MYGVLLAVALSSAAAQQTHPCDVQAPTVYRAPRNQLPNLRIGWCMAPVDTEGVPITESIGFAIRVNGGPLVDLGGVQPITGANARGEFYFEAQTPALAAGTIVIVAYTLTLGSSVPSDPITLTLSGTPKKPQNATIIR